MEPYRTRTMIKLSFIECLRILRSSKCLILLLCAVFININIIEPIRELSQDMDAKASFLEPFVALSNSGLVLLFIPLLFVVMMADFPDCSAFRYFYCVRMSKKRWIAIQLLCIFISTLIYLLTLFLFSVLFSVDYTSVQMEFSNAVRYYSATFPEKSFSYVALLFPLNMLNQLSLQEVVAYSVLTLFLYSFFLIQIALLFSIIGKKIVGIVLDFVIVFAGMVLSSVDTGLQWLFPLSHTVSWWHFREVASKPIFPLHYSIIYLLSINLVMTALILHNSKKVSLE